jgi:hypothetical protein
MKKNNVKTSQRGLKKDSKNKARLVRAKKKRDWAHMVAQVKFMQNYMKKAQAQAENANQNKEA